MDKKTFRTLALIWGALMIAVLSSTITLLCMGAPRRLDSPQAISPDPDSVIADRYRRLDEVREKLMKEYYVELDEDALLLGAIRGMTNAVGDIYTFYYTPEEMKRSDENTSGAYRGIGILLQNTAEGDIVVVRVYRDTPAQAAGIRQGDLLRAVDGEPISGEDGRTYNDAVNRIRGGEGTSVVLTMERDGELIDLTVARADVNVNYADYQMLDGGIGYISITQFTGDAAQVFQEAIETFRAQDARGLVIDVRNNPGGLLDEVVKIADSVLPAGVIVYIRDRDGARQDYYSDAELYDVPLVVLTNDMSASASEILAASVQALERGVVVGTTTYGKGIVQSLSRFNEDGAGMQLTTSVYYDALDRTPNGLGVTPDVELEFEGDDVPLNPDPAHDNQLARAIEIIEAQIAGGGAEE